MWGALRQNLNYSNDINKEQGLCRDRGVDTALE